jgi:hypothetical protein
MGVSRAGTPLPPVRAFDSDLRPPGGTRRCTPDNSGAWRYHGG